MVDIVNEIDIEKRLREVNKELAKYKAREVLNRKQFDFQLCTTKKVISL